MVAAKTEVVSVRVTRKMKQQLRAEARKDKRTLNQYCEMVLEAGLSLMKAKEPDGTRELGAA